MTPESLKLYVDDVRPCPEGWHLATSFHQAIVMLETTQYDIVSLDHDLGCYYGNKELTGDDILQWLISRRVQSGGHVPSTILVHSANPVKSEPMRQDIKTFFGGGYEKAINR